MATGTQTGIRTGSRAGLTAGRGAPPKQSGGLGKIKDIWTGLGKGAKIGIVSLLGLAITGALCFAAVSSANKDVDLYTTKMTAQDVHDVAAKLMEMQIPHQVNVTGDGIILNPKYKAKAQSALAAYGLPKHAIKTSGNQESSALTGKTAAEQKSMRQQSLEGDVTESLRQFDGVADAYVKIAQPEETFFKDDSKPMTATVMLKLTPGTKLTENQIQAVVHLVSYSIPELDKKNVKVVDAQMNDLTAQLEQSEDGSVGNAKQGQLEVGKANELQKKAQKQLDDVFGPNRTKLAVNVEMNFAQKQTTTKTVGGAGDNGTVVTGEQTKVERYNKNPGSSGSSDMGAQMVGEDETEKASLGGGGKKDSDYVQEIKSRKLDYNTSTSTVINKNPEISRITCSVAINNLKPDQVDKIGGLVAGAIGLNKERGDEITAVSVPFIQPAVSVADQQAAAAAFDKGRGPVAQDGKNSGLGSIGVALSVASLMALGLIGVFLMKQHRVQIGKSQPYLESSFSGSTSTDIADLVNDKSGKSNANAETKVNTSDALEKLAKEKPTKVAEMLKSTWLNG